MTESGVKILSLMRGLIVKILREEGRVSGGELGRRLNISRTAVWKHINELRKRGYQIDSTPRGYSLTKSPDLLLPEEINADLSTRVLGRRIVYHEEVTSTQDVAKELARRGAEEGTVVICEKQVGGRGRRGRNWVSLPYVGVYISIILRPRVKPSEVLQIPLLAGVAVCRAIEKVTPLKPRIKWPNDIILGGKKTAGILTEMSAEVDEVDYVVLGIGVNVNTPISLMPEDVREIATSLAAECGDNVSRVRFTQHLLSELETLYDEFLACGFDAIRERWKALDKTIGSRVKISGVDEEMVGEVVDIDREGFLILKGEDGEVKRIVSGDVSLRPYGR